MNHRSVVVYCLGALGLAGALLVNACGGDSSTPTAPNPAQPAPTPTVAPSPTPTPTPTPAPAPAPTPAPTPTPTPTPAPTPTPTPNPTPTPGPSLVVVEILGEAGNMSFSPAAASLRVGDQVRWHNADRIVHTATQDGGGFDTGLIPAGATSAPITVTTSGTLRYHCAVHPSMVGALDVTR